MPMLMRDVIAELRSKPSVSVPVAGKALGDLSRNGSYRLVAEGKFPVPTFDVGGRKRVASATVLKLLGLADTNLQPGGWDGTRVVVDDDHVYLPVGWLAREHPDLADRLLAIEHNVRRACGQTIAGGEIG
jgi:hypothetical protein